MHKNEHFVCVSFCISTKCLFNAARLSLLLLSPLLPPPPMPFAAVVVVVFVVILFLSFFFLLFIRAQPKNKFQNMNYYILFGCYGSRFVFVRVCNVGLCSSYICVPMFVYHSNYAFNFWTNTSPSGSLRPNNVCVCVCLCVCVMRITHSNFFIALE